MYSYPYASRGAVVRDYRDRDSRDIPFSDRDFQSKFYDELDQTIETIESNIDEDLRKEPRWAVFLIERIADRLYDAYNKNDPNRPSPEEIKLHNENTPRAKATAKKKELARWNASGTQELIDSLHKVRNENLAYTFEKLPDNILELSRRENTIPTLVSAYYGDIEDGLYRFNIIMLLNQKLSDEDFNVEKGNAIAKCLVDSLKDTDGRVRAEGIRGLQRLKELNRN